MATGKVKWFNEDKGYGFIVPDDGTEDAFVHITAVKDSGAHPIAEGDNVSFDVEDSRGRNCAVNLAKV